MKPVIERFLAKISISDSGCWNWTSHKSKSGYGMFHLNKKPQLAHRISYEIFKGFIPKGLQIDHLCRNRACVNPDHLEAVTQQENLMRGIGKSAINAIKTHCPQGHEYSEENTILHIKGSRRCKKCIKIHNKTHYLKNSSKLKEKQRNYRLKNSMKQI